MMAGHDDCPAILHEGWIPALQQKNDKGFSLWKNGS
jgi:hypothetical protein